ncbi:FecR domain-containing protein [Methylotenera sp. 1P/1]|uniref:FecR domain-containing protein n=1 Tax=Methylotenera sp. 1P/1 TaxID=1131551 RepID=UPI00037C18B4|nr:FecR domain-containing protein [Methylotenera sp. 1P/1]
MHSKLANKITPAMQEASEWYARWLSGEMDDKSKLTWQSWLDADEEHSLAWQKIERVQKHFDKVPGSLALATLQDPPSAERRRILKHMVLLLAVSGVSYYGYREQPWRGMLADISTSVGERRQIALMDGTIVHLNTDSAINTVFSDTARVVELIRGEIFIETAHEQSSTYRPFSVITRQGSVTALGTQFSVREWQQQDYVKVNVFEGLIEVRSTENADSPVRVSAGESIVFSQSQVLAKTKLKATDKAWVNGLIVVYAMRLQDFVAELSRYHSGVLRCDPAVTNLQISGSFPIGNIEAVLNTLEQTLPVRVRRFTRYWTTLSPS